MNINERKKQILRKEYSMLMSFYVVKIDGEINEKQLKINYFLEEKFDKIEEEIQEINEEIEEEEQEELSGWMDELRHDEDMEINLMASKKRR